MEKAVVADFANVIGENPLWHEEEECLYWCAHAMDRDGELFRYDPATGEAERLLESAYIGGFTIQADGSLLLFMDGRIRSFRDGELGPGVDVTLEDEDEDEVLWNDVIADPEGRVYSGTRYMGDRTGALYRLDGDGSLTQLVTGIHGSNGLGFTPDRSELYYSDSGARRIYKFAYDPETGDLSDQRTFVEVAEDDGVPDGMTVDEEGYVWSAHAYSHDVVRYAPDGTEDRRIEFPMALVTSLTFAGEDYDDLYVTTGGGGDKAQYGEDAGALFRLSPDVGGVPEFRSRIDLE